MKICSKCGDPKPLEAFHKSSAQKDGRYLWCKVCTSLHRKQHYAANKSEMQHKAKKYRENNPEKRREGYYRRTYGLSAEEVNRLLERGCEICKRTDNLRVDHCHVSGKVRGCLCNECNSAIGFMRDNPDLLRVAAIYLERTHV